MSHDEVAALQAKSAAGIGSGGLDAKAMLAWAVVGIPLLWGVWVTLRATFALFG